jgi:hypothetical protein
MAGDVDGSDFGAVDRLIGLDLSGYKAHETSKIVRGGWFYPIASPAVRFSYDLAAIYTREL